MFGRLIVGCRWVIPTISVVVAFAWTARADTPGGVPEPPTCDIWGCIKACYGGNPCPGCSCSNIMLLFLSQPTSDAIGALAATDGAWLVTGHDESGALVASSELTVPTAVELRGSPVAWNLVSDKSMKWILLRPSNAAGDLLEFSVSRPLAASVQPTTWGRVKATYDGQ